MKVNWDDEIPNIWENKKCSKPPTRNDLPVKKGDFFRDRWFPKGRGTSEPRGRGSKTPDVRYLADTQYMVDSLYTYVILCTWVLNTVIACMYTYVYIYTF